MTDSITLKLDLVNDEAYPFRWLVARPDINHCRFGHFFIHWRVFIKVRTVKTVQNITHIITDEVGCFLALCSPFIATAFLLLRFRWHKCHATDKCVLDNRKVLRSHHKGQLKSIFRCINMTHIDAPTRKILDMF